MADGFHAGADEGMRYMEKTVNKHSEIVESIKELSSGLIDLEAKLQVSINLFFIGLYLYSFNVSWAQKHT